MFLAALLLLAAVAVQGASATSPDGCDEDRQEAKDVDPDQNGTQSGGNATAAPSGGNATATPSASASASSGSTSSTPEAHEEDCIVVQVETAGGPCTVVRQVGSRPSVGTDPLLGMIEVDPDHCVKRAIQRAVTLNGPDNPSPILYE